MKIKTIVRQHMKNYGLREEALEKAIEQYCTYLEEMVNVTLDLGNPNNTEEMRMQLLADFQSLMVHTISGMLRIPVSIPAPKTTQDELFMQDLKQVVAEYVLSLPESSVLNLDEFLVWAYESKYKA